MHRMRIDRIKSDLKESFATPDQVLASLLLSVPTYTGGTARRYSHISKMVDDSSDDDALEKNTHALAHSAEESLGGDSEQAQVGNEKSNKLRARLAEVGYSGADIDRIEQRRRTPKKTSSKLDPRLDRFDIIFKCNVCGAPNCHSISRKAYTEGTVIVTCPGCKGNHLIADNLGWIEKNGLKNIEQLAAKRGIDVTRLVKDGNGAGAAAKAFLSVEPQDEGLERKLPQDDDDKTTIEDLIKNGMTKEEAMMEIIKKAQRVYKENKAKALIEKLEERGEDPPNKSYL
jgi:hypothetical protein